MVVCNSAQSVNQSHLDAMVGLFGKGRSVVRYAQSILMRGPVPWRNWRLTPIDMLEGSHITVLQYSSVSRLPMFAKMRPFHDVIVVLLPMCDDVDVDDDKVERLLLDLFEKGVRSLSKQATEKKVSV